MPAMAMLEVGSAAVATMLDGALAQSRHLLIDASVPAPMLLQVRHCAVSSCNALHDTLAASACMRTHGRCHALQSGNKVAQMSAINATQSTCASRTL